MADTRNTPQAKAPASKDSETEATKEALQKQQQPQDQQEEQEKQQEGVPSEPVEPDPVDTVFGNANVPSGPTEEQTAFVPGKDEEKDAKQD